MQDRTYRIGAMASRRARSLRSTTGEPLAQTCRTPSLCPGAFSCTYIVTLVYLRTASRDQPLLRSSEGEPSEVALTRPL